MPKIPKMTKKQAELKVKERDFGDLLSSVKRNYIYTSDITLSKTQLIIFKSGFLNKIKPIENGYLFLVVLYSPAKNALIFEFQNGKEYSRKLYSFKVKNNMVGISLASLYRSYNIPRNEKTLSFNAELENIKGLGERYVIYLDNFIKA